VKIYQGEQGGLQTVTLESERHRVTTVPELGAKLTSLFDKKTGLEWLVQPQKELRKVAYGSGFVAADMSGWDEMFPTIRACDYDDGVLGTRHLPDHGEVWSLPWDVVASTSSSLTLRVTSKVLPYRLTRGLRLREGELEFVYTVVNTGQHDLELGWTAHPQFVAPEGTRVLLPKAVTQVVNAIDSDPKLGDINSLHDWPNGLDKVGNAQQGTCHKVYVPEHQSVTWAGLEHPSGSWLKLSWQADEVPYLGVWVDEGAYSHEATVALEPSTFFYDNLCAARSSGRVMKVGAGQHVTWSLLLQLGQGRRAWQDA
jgi:galactose mutarotase-like enzyme